MPAVLVAQHLHTGADVPRLAVSQTCLLYTSIMVVNLAIGFVTPPIGVNLFVASSLTDVPIMAIAKKAMPMIGLFLVALLLITFIPALSLGLL